MGAPKHSLLVEASGPKGVTDRKQQAALTVLTLEFAAPPRDSGTPSYIPEIG